MTLDERLKVAVQKRDELAAAVQRISGRLEAANKALTLVEQECRDKGYDPDTLDDTLRTAQAKYEQAVANLEKQVSDALTALQPFMETTK
jgi:predicted Zn-ribbon and HTH transcriptional regulator